MQLVASNQKVEDCDLLEMQLNSFLLGLKNNK